MAIRIREQKNEWIALCAAKSIQMAGDIYLDDGMHHALTKKFEKDFRSMGFLAEPVSKNNSYTMLATVPYQCCPVCGGTGRVITALSFACYETCDTCNGKKIIPQAVLPEILKEHSC